MQIFFIRHGQGEHNAAALKVGYGCTCISGRPAENGDQCPYIDESLLDPPLTALGQQQATEARPRQGWPEKVYVSTLQRALQTAQGAFAPSDGFPTPPMLSVEIIREQFGLHHCDARRPLSVIRQQFPDVDFSRVDSEHDPLWQPVRETKTSLAQRGMETLRLLAADPARDIACVSHSSFLLTLCFVLLDTSAAPELASWFATGECRPMVIDFQQLVAEEDR